MSEMSGLQLGITVRIRRTDGREHPAVVTTINRAAKSVMVEWPEQGEVRGKEIDFDTLLSLNDNLINRQNVETLEASKIVRNSSRLSKNFRLPVRSTVKSHDETTVPSNGTTERGLPIRGVENIPPSQHQISYNNRNNNVVDDSRPTGIRSTIPVHNVDKKPGRRSTVVKEVEKLQQNREERRQRQAEKKEEREALMNVEPGHPKWQFSHMIRDYRQNVDFRPLRVPELVESHQITVCVRKRPLNKSEIVKKELDVVSIPRKDTIVVHEPKHKVDLTKYLENQQFRFDYAFDENCSNELVYHYTAKPLVQTVFEGGMATCFAYGQTGSGKTHTMGGTFTGKIQDCNKGIYAMVAKDFFAYLNSTKQHKLIVTSSFFEIYSGKVFDLLADKAKLRVLEDGKQQVQVVGLTEKVVSSVDQVLALISAGNAARTSGQTSANSNSSRSHAVFQLTLRNASHRIHGKFSLIDLAGNERGADTMSADRLTRMEGAEINKSLLALKECIRALGRKGAHLPFRVSKLTQVLRDSFIGDNSRTCMIAMISPGMGSCEHSLNTLRYADRVKELAAVDPSSVGRQESPIVEPMDDDGGIVDLRSLDEGELSADLCNFHEALTHLQQLEDDVVDSLKSWTDGRLDEIRLLEMSRNVDYDQDCFASQLDELLSGEARQLDNLRDKVKAFRQQLSNEEEISKKINASKPQPRLK